MFSQFCSLVILTGIVYANRPHGISPREAFANAERVLEVFWESYLSFPHTLDTCLDKKFERIEKRETDNEENQSGQNPFAFDLRDIPIPSGKSENTQIVVNIAFADANLDNCNRRFVCHEFVCGIHLYEDLDEAEFENLKGGIKKLQQDGVIVKLAFGGQEYGNTMLNIKTTRVADTTIDIIVDSVQALGVDGLDLVQEEGCGSHNLECEDQSSTHLYFLRRLREELPDKIISYTFPTGQYGINFPFSDVLRYGTQDLDSINMFGTNFEGARALEEFPNVERKKIMLGFPIGCDQAPFRNVSLIDAKMMVTRARDEHLKGISLWSINRDTNRRGSSGNGCNEYQTGEEDGKFFTRLLSLL